MGVKEIALSKGPHKILTLDGGGIRGAITIEILAKIEKIVQKKGAKTLADYFDYVSGTSTGAILATGIALGWSVDKLRRFYERQGNEMFDKTFLLNKLHYKYDDDNLRKTLKSEIGNISLGSPKLKTLLAVMMRNATTDSPWPLSNNPFAKYNDRKRADCNLELPLWQLVRASTAAPTYFPPECITLGDREFIFVDGGVTSYNNPSFHTFIMATAEPYRLGWESGEDNMLIVSVGTGSSPMANGSLVPGDMNLIFNAKKIPAALMFAALNEQDLLCRVFGNCLSGDIIDREVGDMCSTANSMCEGPVNPKLFTYVRYNAQLTKEGLEDLGIKKLNPFAMQSMDTAGNIPSLQKIGRAVARKRVKASHFSHF